MTFSRSRFEMRYFLFFSFIWLWVALIPRSLPAQELEEKMASSKEMVAKAWEASGQNNLEKVIEWTTACENLYGPRARQLQSELNNFPPSEQKKITGC